MIRQAWIPLALILAAGVGFFAAHFTVDLIELLLGRRLDAALQATLQRDALLHWAGGIGFGALTFFLTGFAIPAAIDGYFASQVRLRIEEWLRKQDAEEALDRATFESFFESCGSYESAAQAYLPTLEAVSNPAGSSKLKVPPVRPTAPIEAFFGRRVTVDDWLSDRLYYLLPRLTATSGLVVAALIVALSLIAGGTANASLSPLENGLRAALPGAVLPLLAAVIVATLRPIILQARYYQADRLNALATRALGGPPETSQRLALIEELHTFKTTISGHKTSLEKTMIKGNAALRDGLSEALNALGNELTSAVTRSLEQPITELATATAQISADQSRSVQQLVDKTLTKFITELDKIVGQQLKDINKVLQSSATTAEKVETSFSEAARKIAAQANKHADQTVKDYKTALTGMTAQQEKSRKALSDEMTEIGKTLATHVATHSKEIEKTLTEALDKTTDSIESALAQTGGDLIKTADSFSALREVLDNLTTLITPILRQVIDNQESLLAALESDSSSSKTIGRSANELNAAAQASRETVERFIALAERLRETSSTISAAIAANARSTVENRSARRTQGGNERTSLSAAIRELRSESFGEETS